MNTPEKAVLFAGLDQLLRYRENCDRVYFGQEFCQRLFPSADAVRRAIAHARERNISFTLVTPFATNAGLVRVRAAVEAAAGAPGLEVVVNDWGVLRFMHRDYPAVPLALGRLLTKQKRGPQLLAIRDKISETALDHFRRSNADVPHVREFLKTMGVVRIELDNLLQGMARSEGLPASLYHPYGYITVTRLCLLAEGSKPTKNLRSLGRCSRECALYEVTLTHDDMPVPIQLRGNAQFFRKDSLPTDLAALNVTRLVYEPRIPI